MSSNLYVDIFIRKYEDDAPITVITIRRDERDNQIRSISRSNSAIQVNQINNDDSKKYNLNDQYNKNEFTVYDLK